MVNSPSSHPDDVSKELPKPPAEIYVADSDTTRSQEEKELYQKQRSLAIAHAIKTRYDSTQLQTLDAFEELTDGDVIFTVNDEGVEHSIVEEINGDVLTIRYFNRNGSETVNKTPVDEIVIPEGTEIFVIKGGDTD